MQSRGTHSLPGSQDPMALESDALTAVVSADVSGDS